MLLIISVKEQWNDIATMLGTGFTMHLGMNLERLLNHCLPTVLNYRIFPVASTGRQDCWKILEVRKDMTLHHIFRPSGGR